MNKEPLLKKTLAEQGVAFCGLAESQTYRNRHLNDQNWIWDPGVETCPSPEHKHPPGGIGVLVARSISHSVVHTGKYSMWVRIELEGRPPLFICECYFPHSSKTRKHRAGWNEVAESASLSGVGTPGGHG